MQDMPKTILNIILVLLLISIGLFIVIVFTSNVGLISDTTETFAVENPTVDQTVTLSHKPASKPTVWQYNGFEWLLVNPSYVSYNGNQLTVQSGGLQG